MSLIRYTPYLMSDLQQQINRMFDQAGRDAAGSEGLGGGMFTPAVDIKEDAEAYTVHMELPGVPQDKVNITLQENVLLIRGQKDPKQEHGEGQYRRVERSYGAFARSLTLPRNVNSKAVTADLHAGVLAVRLPKQEEAKPRQITIGIGGSSGQAQVARQAEQAPSPSGGAPNTASSKASTDPASGTLETSGSKGRKSKSGT